MDISIPTKVWHTSCFCPDTVLTLQSLGLPKEEEKHGAMKDSIPYKTRMRSHSRSASVDILDGHTFQRMLCLERKRSERSSRCFILMLLACRADGDEQVLEKTLRVLPHCTRETDITGWHKEGSEIGVIFTEIGSGEGRVAANALRIRITEALGNVLSEDLSRINVSLHVFPEDSGKQDGPCDPVESPFYPDLVPEMNRRNTDRFLKRAMDIAGGCCALMVFSPLFLAIAAAVKLSSKGPILFKQKRVGQFGRTFTFLKFRTMYDANDNSIHQKFVQKFIAGEADTDQEASQQKVYKLTKDPRVTPLGRYLRRTSLDELPQVFNVLQGEMSLVGPRPPIPYEFACYSTWQKRRLMEVKPGITGLWQVNGRSRTTFAEMVRLDLRYARTWSLWLDVKILWQTPAAMFSGDGAY